MASLRAWIEIATGNTKNVEAVVIGEMGGCGDYDSEGVPDCKSIPKFVVLTWKEARKWLDYEFDDGFGAPGCNAIYVWTKDRVYFVSQYDGATCLSSVPRNPMNCKPHMPGGG